MVIANFREYTAVLRDVYSRDAMGEIGAYYQALTNSGEELKQQKLKLLEQIGARKREIDRQAQLIRTTTDKKAAGLRLARIKKQKQDMIRALKVLQNGDHFNVLSDEAKTGVCSGFLLQKYLTRELLEHNPLNFAKDANGNLLVDTERLKHSAIFQEAVHLRDFVAAYMAKYPDKVKTPGHFKTLLNNVKDWRGVLEYADAFFARLNDDAHLTDDMIKASRQGVEVIRVFPGKNVQLVRLRTVEALDYETARMDHCVGKGSYDAAVLNGKTAIYSLRDLSAENEWLPHATIECKDGAITQVKGYKNKEINPQYYPEIRASVFAVYGSEDIAELHRQGKVRDLQNWGYVIDVRGIVRDYYNLNEEIELSEADIWKVPPEKAAFISARTVKIGRIWNRQTTEKLKQFRKIDSFDLSEMTEGIAEARKYIAEQSAAGNQEAAKALNNSRYVFKLGYAARWTGKRELCFQTEPEPMIDLLNVTEPIKVSNINYTPELSELLSPERLSTATLTVSGKITGEMLEKIARFRSIDNLFFKDADFSALRSADLSKVRMSESNVPANDLAYMEEACMVAENAGYITNIAKFAEGRMIRFYNCKKLPDPADIRFPANVRHLVIDAENKLTDKVSEIDFAKYQSLETLQFNNFDFENCSRITLPESLSYLGFGSCTLKPCKTFDLDVCPGLQQVRLAASDLSGIKRIVFPSAMEKCSVSGCSFKTDSVLDYGRCSGLANLELSGLNSNQISCKEIMMPESLKQLSINHIVFPQLETLDLGKCRQLEKVYFSHVNFPRLKKLVVPECEFKQDKFTAAPYTETITVAPQQAVPPPAGYPRTTGTER
mgnify:FL=1